MLHRDRRVRLTAGAGGPGAQEVPRSVSADQRTGTAVRRGVLLGKPTPGGSDPRAPRPASGSPPRPPTFDLGGPRHGRLTPDAPRVARPGRGRQRSPVPRSEASVDRSEGVTFRGLTSPRDRRNRPAIGREAPEVSGLIEEGGTRCPTISSTRNSSAPHPPRSRPFVA